MSLSLEVVQLDKVTEGWLSQQGRHRKNNTRTTLQKPSSCETFLLWKKSTHTINASKLTLWEAPLLSTPRKCALVVKNVELCFSFSWIQGQLWRIIAFASFRMDVKYVECWKNAITSEDVTGKKSIHVHVRCLFFLWEGYKCPLDVFMLQFSS